MSELTLPDGLTARVLTMDDARAVYDVAAAQEQHDIGKTEIKPADIIKKTEKTLVQAEGSVAALEAKAEEDAKEKPPAEKSKGKDKGKEVGKDQGKGAEKEKGKAAEKSSAAQPVAARVAVQ